MKHFTAWCPACAREVNWVTPREVCNRLGVCRQTVSRWIRRDQVHSLELPGGHYVVCEASLGVDMRLR